MCTNDRTKHVVPWYLGDKSNVEKLLKNLKEVDAFDNNTKNEIKQLGIVFTEHTSTKQTKDDNKFYLVACGPVDVKLKEPFKSREVDGMFFEISRTQEDIKSEPTKVTKEQTSGNQKNGETMKKTVKITTSINLVLIERKASMEQAILYGVQQVRDLLYALEIKNNVPHQLSVSGTNAICKVVVLESNQEKEVKVTPHEAKGKSKKQ
jgi:hypothetical protein